MSTLTVTFQEQRFTGTGTWDLFTDENSNAMQEEAVSKTLVCVRVCNGWNCVDSKPTCDSSESCPMQLDLLAVTRCDGDQTMTLF